MAHIDLFFATLSPYAYLAGQRVEEVAAKHGATITYKPFDIVSVFGRTGGTAPKDRHISRMEYRAQELIRQAKKADLPFNLKPAHWPTNGAPIVLLKPPNPKPPPNPCSQYQNGYQ